MDEQTRALLAAPIRRTTGMTGSERRRAAQHARLGMPEVSTADEPALLRTRPRQPERVAPSATGVLADTWGSLDVEDLISAVKNSEDAVMEAEDEAVQKVRHAPRPCTATQCYSDCQS